MRVQNFAMVVSQKDVHVPNDEIDATKVKFDQFAEKLATDFSDFLNNTTSGLLAPQYLGTWESPVNQKKFAEYMEGVVRAMNSIVETLEDAGDEIVKYKDSVVTSA
jgi:hypothetical protein